MKKKVTSTVCERIQFIKNRIKEILVYMLPENEKEYGDLLNEFEENPTKIWESNIFGKSLHELVNDGLHNKLYKMSDDAQYKLQETLQKIINEGSGGLICIIL